MEKGHSSDLQCSTNFTAPEYDVFWVYECCTSGDFCNDGPFPEDDTKPEEITPEDNPNNTMFIVSVVFGSITLIVIIISIVTGILIWRSERKEIIVSPSAPPSSSLATVPSDNLESTCTSGSGKNGPPLLVQRTLSKSIQLEESIGEGRFGNVRKGLWRDEFVAVKIFNGRDEASWRRESKIYRTVLERHHENILTFYTSEDIGTCPAEFWLVTQYHRSGSLFDYLNGNTLTQDSLLRLAGSLAKGLAFLHVDLARTGVSTVYF